MGRNAHVIGGGIGGLAVAAGLAQRGWQVVVHERADTLREVGAGIYLKENGVRVLERLDCLAPIVAESTRIKRSEIHDGNDRVLLARNVSSERVFTVLRATLHRELARSAERWGVSVETGSEVTSVTPEGRLELVGGKSYRADLIVGADGTGSLTRQQVGLEHYAKLFPNGSTRILIPWQEGDETDRSIEWWNGHKRVMIVPVGRDVTYICASSRESDTRGAALPFDRDYWSADFPWLRRFFERVDPATAIHHPHGKVRVKGWHRGRVAILGDAVHGQPPNLGQGAGLAISNGASLVDHLERAPVAEALPAWEAAGRTLTEQVQSWSENWDHFVHRWPLPIESWRSAAIWLLANVPATRKRWGLLYRGIPAAS